MNRKLARSYLGGGGFGGGEKLDAVCMAFLCSPRPESKGACARRGQLTVRSPFFGPSPVLYWLWDFLSGMGQGELTAEDQSAPKLGRGVTKKSLIRWHSVQPEPDTGESGRRRDVDLGSERNRRCELRSPAGVVRSCPRKLGEGVGRSYDSPSDILDALTCRLSRQGNR